MSVGPGDGARAGRCPVFTIGGLTFGIIICNDSNHPDTARRMASQGATALFVPSNNGLPPHRADVVAASRAADIACAIDNGVSVIRGDVAGHPGSRSPFPVDVRADLPGAFSREFSSYTTAMMKKTVPAASPDAYLAALAGWQLGCAEALRASVKKAATLEEVVKWGHLVYLANGPVLLIRAEEQRVLFGFWRGQRLRDVEPRLKPGGKYEMATVELHEGDAILSATVGRLVRDAVALNADLGDPRLDAGKR